jgi:hypothetical protein
VAITPPRWLRRTWCALHLAPYDPESNPEIEDYLSREMDAYLRHVELFRYYGEWYYGGIPNFWKDDLYAWADYGRYAYILNEQDIVQTPWLLYLRSGDRKHLKFAMANTRHLMEVATINWHDVWPDAVGMSRRHHECIWLGGPDSGHSMVDPFLEYYFSCGYKPAWEAALRMGRTMAATKEGSWRYLSNPLAGCSRMYLETQDPFFKEHALRMWNDLCYPDRNEWFAMDHGRRAAMWHMQINPQAREIFREWMGDPEPDPKKSKAERLRAPRTQALMWIETGDAKDALPLLKMVEVKEKSTRTKDPVLDGIWSITQYVLADVAEKTYMGEALAAAKKAAPPQPEAAKPPAKK